MNQHQSESIWIQFSKRKPLYIGINATRLKSTSSLQELLAELISIAQTNATTHVGPWMQTCQCHFESNFPKKMQSKILGFSILLRHPRVIMAEYPKGHQEVGPPILRETDTEGGVVSYCQFMRRRQLFAVKFMQVGFASGVRGGCNYQTPVICPPVIRTHSFPVVAPR